MQGLYADDAYRLVLVVATGENEGSIDRASDGTLTLRVADDTSHGIYDETLELRGAGQPVHGRACKHPMSRCTF